MAFDASTDLEPGRLAHATQATVDTLRQDSELVDWLGGDPAAIINGRQHEEIPSRALAVEGVVDGSNQSASISNHRPIVQLMPFVSRSVYRVEGIAYLQAIIDRATAYVEANGIGPEYALLGATDDASMVTPESGDDLDATMQTAVRLRFASQIHRPPDP